MAKILVAEDSLTHMEVLRSILESDQHDVDCVEDGQQALDYLNDNSCDAIVTDLNMPVLDGCQLVQHLTNSDPEIPIVVVTARGSESLAVDALAIGATDFVPKDSLQQLLTKVVRQVLGYRVAEAQASGLAGQLRKPEFYFKLTNDIGSIPVVANYLVTTMAAAKCGNPNLRYRTATAMASAIFNAIQYGNLQIRESQILDPQHADAADCDLAVRVKVSIANSDTRISVAHEGKGAITRTTPAPGTPESFEIEQCRGLMLMTSFMNDVMFNHRRSEVTLVVQH
ncbi:response regulator [Crateriforma conspicua]|uniref:Response regulator MprA n=1 Tax=Crateriforma conspicua TaxID=2527996 RepID=A0A5C5YB90_9PLAN|nr:response regulator [Crateriforma conspicua]QDV61514.1 Response regulator MprA [Crateriforma conspicua]TWT72239.1 Response regulator MprA [Crateriforma conspicua]